MGSNCQFADESRRLGANPGLLVKMDALVAEMLLDGTGYDDAVRDFKRAFLRRLLVANRGHQGDAAQALRMHRNTLARTMLELGLELSEIRRSIRPGRANHHRSEEHECRP